MSETVRNSFTTAIEYVSAHGDRRVEAAAVYSSGRQLVTFSLAGLVPGARLVWYPGCGEGFMRLHGMALRRTAAGDAQVLWSMDDPAAFAATADLAGMNFSTSILGSVFVIQRADACLTWVPAGSADVSDCVLEVEFESAKGADYLVARDGFLRERELLVSQVRDLEERVAGLEADREELRLIKRSRVWRAAEVLRVFVYVRLLGAFPAVQRRVLALSRRDGRALSDGRAGVPADAIGRDPHAAYRAWRERHAPGQAGQELARRRIAGFAHRPQVSLLMPVYNVDPEWLERAIDSVRVQWYENWELCIVNDCSTRQDMLEYLGSVHDPKIKIRHLRKNKNISGATNEAARMASGEYFALMDNDDELSPDALYEMISAVNAHDADLLYSDEDFIDIDGQLINPHFKPDFSVDLLLSHNYITHLLMMRRSLFEKIGGFNSECDGAQDYDLVLRATETTNRIFHVPKVLYHWRMSEQSTSMDADSKPAALAAAHRALEDALARREVKAEVLDANIPHFFRIKRALLEDPPALVSIVIPFRDKPELLRMCVGSILERTTYSDFEVVGVSNNSEGLSTFEAMRELEARDPRVRFVEHNIPFSFSRLVNFGVSKARGRHVVLLNNDIEILSWEWLQAMLEHSQRPEVGAVGAKLYYPDNTIQHAGIVVGIGGYAGHAHKHFDGNATGYFNRLNVVQDVSAVTGACLMVKRGLFLDAGGFDEEHFGVACNDVDFCLRLAARGLLNVFTPYAEAYHHESLSRGYEDTPEKIARFNSEKEFFAARHARILAAGDPYYNVNLSLDTESFDFRD